MKNKLNSGKRSISILMILAAIILVINSCSKSTDYNTTGTTGTTGGAGGPGTNEVFIQGMAFTPSNLTVAAGTTVTWTNKDAISHTVTSNTNLFNSGNMGSGSTFSFTFATAGTYPYFCSIHPTMTAQVTVN